MVGIGLAHLLKYAPRLNGKDGRMSAMTSLQPQTDGAAIVSAPLLIRKKAAGKKKGSVSDESMESIIAKLAALRERYLSEMQAARDRVKKNFLR